MHVCVCLNQYNIACGGIEKVLQALNSTTYFLLNASNDPRTATVRILEESERINYNELKPGRTKRGDTESVRSRSTRASLETRETPDRANGERSGLVESSLRRIPPRFTRSCRRTRSQHTIMISCVHHLIINSQNLFITPKLVQTVDFRLSLLFFCCKLPNKLRGRTKD